MIDLTGKTAFVSGGGFIGNEIALNFARAGARLFVADISSEALEDSRRAVLNEVPAAQVASCTFDLCQPESIRAAVDRAAVTCGTIDCLVNVVGAFESTPV